MMMSDLTCFDQFFVNPTTIYSSWSDELSVSSGSFLPQQNNLIEPSIAKNTLLLEDQTTFNSGQLPCNTIAGFRAQNPTYNLAEDILIYSTVSKAKNKLSAKKMVAKRLGRSYSGILNRYHILKSLSEEEIKAIIDKNAYNEASANAIFVNIKRVSVGNSRGNTWKLSSFVENGIKGPEFELKKIEPNSAKNNSSGPPGKSESTDNSLQPQRKVSERRVSKKIVRGPYNTQTKKALEQIRGQGSLSLSNFLEELLTKGLQSSLFCPEDICENVYKKYRHPSRLIEKVIACASSSPTSEG
jgi:hypothetical protein